MRLLAQSEKTCAQCGFLGIRVASDDLAEFAPDTGSPNRQRILGRSIVSGIGCSRHASDLRREIKEASSRIELGQAERPLDAPDAALREVIHKGRACAFFFRYVQGADPKRHLKLEVLGHMEKQRRAWTLLMVFLSAAFGAIATAAVLRFVG